MNDVLIGARRALGAAPVMLAVLFCLVRVAEWRWENAVEGAHEELLSADALLLKWAPAPDASQSTIDRYNELVEASK